VPRRIGYRIPQAEPSGRRRVVPVAAVAIAAVAIAAMTFAAIRSSPMKRLAHKPTAGPSGAVATARLPGGAGAFTQLERHREPPPRPVVHARGRPHGHPAPPPPSRITFVRATAEPVSSAAAASTAQAPVRQASQPQRVVVTQRVVTTAAPTHTTSETARPPESTGSGRPAFGQNGLLGPGSSPNS
jgi:hypothetical protein